MDTLDFHRVVLLFDLYQSLLTKKQKSIMEKRFLDDYSLSEIADGLSISRSAVQDTIHKAMQKLEKFETSLKLLYSQQERMSLVDALENTELKESQKTLLYKLKDVI